MKTEKDLIVKPIDDCIVWRADAADVEYAKTIEIHVGKDCYAVMYVNGRKYRVFPSGEYNFDWRATVKNIGDIAVVALHTGGRARVPFGAGRVEYSLAGCACEVGWGGTCVLKPIYDRAMPEAKRYAACEQLYAAHSKKDKIGSTDICLKWHAKISDAAKTAFACAVESCAVSSRDELLAAFDDEIKPAIRAALDALAPELAADGLEICDVLFDRPFVSEPVTPPVEEETEEETVDEQPDENEEETVDEESEESEEELEWNDIICHACGRVIDAAAKFCKYCGARVEADDGLVECPSCKRRVLAGAKFCKYCGERMDKPAFVECPNCKNRMPAGAGFCGFCGAKLH